MTGDVIDLSDPPDDFRPGAIDCPNPGGQWEPVQLAAPEPPPRVRSLIAAVVRLRAARNAAARNTARPRHSEEFSVDTRVHDPATGRTFDGDTGAELTPPRRPVELAYTDANLSGLPPIKAAPVFDVHGSRVDDDDPADDDQAFGPLTHPDSGRDALIAWHRREYPHMHPDQPSGVRRLRVGYGFDEWGEQTLHGQQIADTEPQLSPEDDLAVISSYGPAMREHAIRAGLI